MKLAFGFGLADGMGNPQGDLAMSQIFDYLPHVELLKILARGSLKQSLPKTLRLWVILRSLYGEDSDPVRVNLENRFTYSDWYQLFFTQPEENHKYDRVPIAHDPNCPCAKTIADWLFDENFGVKDREWQVDFGNFYPIEKEEFNNLLDFGLISTGSEKQRLLAKTRKTIESDFDNLVTLGWLHLETIPVNPRATKIQRYYHKVEKFPDRALFGRQPNGNNNDVLNALQNDLVDFCEDFALQLNGQQRFFLELEYIVHSRFYKKMHRFRQQFKEIWQAQTIPPIKITYVSARKFQNHQDEGEEYIVYPVCIYYSHRAPYLFAYGQTPIGDRPEQLDWYDYRLDRIQDLQELQWNQINLPNFSPAICKEKTPQQIEAMMSEAFGFDFYKPKELLLLRFERYFHYRYVEGTEREEIFKKIPFAEAVAEVKRADIDLAHKQQILQLLTQRSPQDIYCRLYYRQGDNNAIMRLRAWGPKVEVFLPYSLRQRMTDDLRATWKLYNNSQ